VLLLLDSEKFGLRGKSGAVQAECVGSSFTGDPFQTFARIRKWLHRLQRDQARLVEGDLDGVELLAISFFPA
jgi:hypothetical protein